jgi:hypothetical protein
MHTLLAIQPEAAAVFVSICGIVLIILVAFLIFHFKSPKCRECKERMICRDDEGKHYCDICEAHLYDENGEKISKVEEKPDTDASVKTEAPAVKEEIFLN